MSITDEERGAWIDLVSEASTWRDRCLFFAEAGLADPVRTALRAGMTEAEIVDAILAGRQGWNLGELHEFVASIREDRNVMDDLTERTIDWLRGDGR